MQPSTPARRPTTPATAITDAPTRFVSQLKTTALNPVAAPAIRAAPIMIASSWNPHRASHAGDNAKRRRPTEASVECEGGGLSARVAPILSLVCRRPQLQGALGLTAPNCAGAYKCTRSPLQGDPGADSCPGRSVLPIQYNICYNDVMELFPRPCRRKRARRRSAGLFACCLALLLAGGLLAGCSWTIQPAAGDRSGAVGADRARPIVRSRRRRNARRAPGLRTIPSPRRTAAVRTAGNAALARRRRRARRAKPQIYAWSEPRPGWYLNWSVGFTETVWITGTLGAQPPSTSRPRDGGHGFAPMVRTPQGRLGRRRVDRNAAPPAPAIPG